MGFRKNFSLGYRFLVGETTLVFPEMYTWFAITLPVILVLPLMVTVRFSAKILPLIVELPIVSALPVPRILKRTFATGTFTREIVELLMIEKFPVTLIR